MKTRVSAMAVPVPPIPFPPAEEGSWVIGYTDFHGNGT